MQMFFRATLLKASVSRFKQCQKNGRQERKDKGEDIGEKREKKVEWRDDRLERQEEIEDGREERGEMRRRKEKKIRDRGDLEINLRRRAEGWKRWIGKRGEAR